MKPNKLLIIVMFVILGLLVKNAAAQVNYSDKEFKTPHPRDLIILRVKIFTGWNRWFSRGKLFCENPDGVKENIYISKRDTTIYKINSFLIERDEFNMVYERY